MRKIVSEVASVVRDLETLNLITRGSLRSVLMLKNDKHIFEVKFVVEQVSAEYCVEMLESIKVQNNMVGNISVNEQGLFGKSITATFLK